MRKLIQIFLILLLSFLLSAFATVPEEEAKADSSITGRINVVGSDPFNEIMIETDSGELYQVLNDKGLTEQEGALIYAKGQIQSCVSLYTNKAIIIEDFTLVKHGAMPEE